ncbi:MAG TPA: type II secretion system protein GspC [Nevskia sp.]|jgi:general secretion pathway protein C|nr:type II secretion system protein GspC [Nevskia sp.]
MSSITLRDWSALPKTLAPLYERYARWLPAAVDVVLAVLIARLLAQLVWALVPAPAAAAWQPAPVAVAAPNPADRIDVNRIIGAHLFGVYNPAPAKSDIAKAPDTTLNLTLLGILANSKNKAASRALISSGSEEKPYSVNDAISAGVTLYAIFPDRVVLSRNGQLETLRLDKDQPNSDAAPLAVAEGNANDGAAQSLAQIRQQMLANPAKVQDYIRVQPAPNATGNGQMGYRIFPGRDRAVFAGAGLHPGDVVTAINGVQLDDPAKSLQLLSDLSQAGSVTLTVQRGGESQTINVNLSP